VKAKMNGKIKVRSEEEVMKIGAEVHRALCESAHKGEAIRFYYFKGALDAIEWVLGLKDELPTRLKEV